MAKRTHKEVRTQIFKVLSDCKEHSFADLERKVNTNWRTIRDHLDYMLLFKAVEIDEENKVRITKFGLSVWKSLKK